MTLAEIEKRYRDYLSKADMLYTKERALILQSVLSRNDHFSADDLLFHMHAEGSDVSRATLYRNLKLLAKAGLLIEADFGHGHIHYEPAVGSNPHEHLICTKCGAVTEVSTAKLDEAIYQAAKTQGFQVEHHLLKVFGLCAKCQ